MALPGDMGCKFHENRLLVTPLMTRLIQFTRHLNIPYCSLYDLGYTSLGGTNDTHPNPKLAFDRGSDTSAEGLQGGIGRAETEVTRYRPAYELIDDEEERLGRDR